MARRFSLRISIVVSLIALLSIVGAGTAAAAAPNPPNCMGKDMGFWAREGSIAGETGDATFTSGAGWGGYVAQNAQAQGSLFGYDTWGHAMKAHLDGAFFGGLGITCKLPGA